MPDSFQLFGSMAFCNWVFMIILGDSILLGTFGFYVTVLSHSHYFITFDLERIRCATTSVLLELLHVSIHGSTFTEDREAATIATFVNPALLVTRVASKVRKCAELPENLRSEISFLRTCNIPNLISYKHRIDLSKHFSGCVST